MMSRILRHALLTFLLWSAYATAPLSAQDPAPGRSAVLRVFLECSGGGDGCDRTEIRTQIDWVDWVRDRTDADVHVIVTNQETGSGGRNYTLDFIGVGRLEAARDELTYVSLGTDVRDETVRGLTRTLAVGLARFSVLAGAPARLEIRPLEARDTDRLVTEAEVDDPWNFWVFELGLDGRIEGETTQNERRLGGSFDATRTTVDWKVEFNAEGRWSREEIQLSEDTIVDTRREWETDAAAAYSLADRWSLGVETGASAATSTNQDLSVWFTPALEYSVWPYAESPRRSARARYRIGVRYFDYEETTLFGFDRETRGVEELELSINQRQPWGSVFANLEGSHYLHDLSKFRVSSGGFLSLRIVRGLNLNLNGRVSWIRDQLFLSVEGVSDEEILLERRRLASNFDYDLGIGLSFQFGSIFNNVVNSRF